MPPPPPLVVASLHISFVGAEDQSQAQRPLCERSCTRAYQFLCQDHRCQDEAQLHGSSLPYLHPKLGWRPFHSARRRICFRHPPPTPGHAPFQRQPKADQEEVVSLTQNCLCCLLLKWLIYQRSVKIWGASSQDSVLDQNPGQLPK